MIRFWRLTSEGMELFPWETTWFIREIGRSRVDHSLSAATLRGMTCPTPTWQSSRHATFMRIEPAYPPHPWMLEDIQLRCEAAADRMSRAMKVGARLQRDLPRESVDNFALNLLDLGRFQRRALAYAYHLRETNIATCLRAARADKEQATADRLAQELLAVMKADLENVYADGRATVADPTPATAATAGSWPEMETSRDLARRDMQKFLATYFGDAPDTASKGIFSATSR
jgi:ribosomal protein L12E/L44/L45/RPP1/RPP2